MTQRRWATQSGQMRIGAHGRFWSRAPGARLVVIATRHLPFVPWVRTARGEWVDLVVPPAVVVVDQRLDAFHHGRQRLWAVTPTPIVALPRSVPPGTDDALHLARRIWLSARGHPQMFLWTARSQPGSSRSPATTRSTTQTSRWCALPREMGRRSVPPPLGYQKGVLDR